MLLNKIGLTGVCMHSFRLFRFTMYQKNRGRESTVVYDNNYYLAVPKLVQRTLAPLNEKPNHSSMNRGLAICHTKLKAPTSPKSNNAISSVGCLR